MAIAKQLMNDGVCIYSGMTSYISRADLKFLFLPSSVAGVGPFIHAHVYNRSNFILCWTEESTYFANILDVETKVNALYMPLYKPRSIT